ncbi:MAG TPA: hypothetical protein VGX48_21475 [Pyrinomonadaceae bacterium]|jgi:hypothetical protein|nr:hypothetical protein [Pyrinomonadaceae bacterium]
MSPSAVRRTQELTIIAQDPSVKVNGRILTAQVSIPAEELAPGPRGYRVQVIDYDSSTGDLYPPLEYRILGDGSYNDPFKGELDKTLLGDPKFHAQNVYAVIMRTLSRFESALGRRVGWGFLGHQLQVAPHAFAEANAFYSKEDRALLFGYFPKSTSDPPPGQRPEWVFTCLSHDVIVHETTHALLDGLRGRYTDPSSPDQAGFHEGFADIVALLSIFSLPSVVEMIIDKNFIDTRPENARRLAEAPELIDVKSLTVKELRSSLLTGLGEEVGQQMGRETAGEGGVAAARMGALRRSVTLTPEEYVRNTDEFKESHRRGEVLVAAVMNAFLDVWVRRLRGLGSKSSGEVWGASVAAPPPQPPPDAPATPEAGGGQAGPRPDAVAAEVGSGYLNRARVVEEGAGAADYLLTMVIRAIDYSPPTDLAFGDFLSAMLTADREIRPDDSKYEFRKTLRRSFAGYNIQPTSNVNDPEPGIWEPPDCSLHYERIRLDSLMRDPDEMFRFIWENRKELGLEEDAYTRVISVRPCVRTNPDDGFTLRETVAEFYQYLQLKAREVKHLGIKTPQDSETRGAMPDDLEVILYGGGALIFDEFGQLKFNVRNRLLSPVRQTNRLKHLWESEGSQAFPSHDAPAGGSASEKRFAKMHRLRYGVFPIRIENEEAWDHDNLQEGDEEEHREVGEEAGAQPQPAGADENGAAGPGDAA